MEFTRETATGNLIRAIEDDRVLIGENWMTGNLIVTADRILRDWAPTDAEKLELDDLAPALAFDPEIVIVGSAVGEPDIALMEALARRAVGLELMRRRSACRTFNVLLHEGRRVALALIESLSST